MTASERRASGALATLFALRMLGLFLVLPVFALEARRLPGGDDPALVGLAMGIYGLTQALLQIPYGAASDRLGRKRVIVAGLLVFAAGSFLAAWAPSLPWLAAARALQGAGAISAAVTALLADQTRDAVRTKAMALVGIGIGGVFALALVAAPWLAARIGLAGLFVLTGAFALGGIALAVWGAPPEPPRQARPPRGALAAVLRHPELLRLNAGVFVLHAVQLAMWVAVPALLVEAGLPAAAHWKLYVPAVLGSFLVMGALLFPLERRGHLRAVFLLSIGLVLAVQLGLLGAVGQTGSTGSTGPAGPSWLPLAALGGLLLLFFCGFNVLEATQPSLVSRTAPAASRGAALGIYNTLQSLGFFAGGAAGGWLLAHAGARGLFAACAAATALWLALAWRMPVAPAAQP